MIPNYFAVMTDSIANVVIAAMFQDEAKATNWRDANEPTMSVRPIVISTAFVALNLS